jgi:hypothetical protein
VDTRLDAFVKAQSLTTELVTKLAESTERLGAAVVAYSTPAPVVEITEAKSAKARKSTPAKATAKTATTTKEVVTLEIAQQRVDAGESPWKVFVASNTTGEPIPYQKVVRALMNTGKPAKAQKAAPKPTKAVKALGTNASVYFGMSKADLLADGSKGAQAEIARREAKRNSK